MKRPVLLSSFCMKEVHASNCEDDLFARYGLACIRGKGSEKSSRLAKAGGRVRGSLTHSTLEVIDDWIDPFFWDIGYEAVWFCVSQAKMGVKIGIEGVWLSIGALVFCSTRLSRRSFQQARHSHLAIFQTHCKSERTINRQARRIAIIRGLGQKRRVEVVFTLFESMLQTAAATWSRDLYQTCPFSSTNVSRWPSLCSDISVLLDLSDRCYY